MNRSSIVGGIDETSQPLVDAQVSDLQSQINLITGTDAEDKSQGALQVEVASVLSYRRTLISDKRAGVFPLIHYLISGDVQKIKTIIVVRSEILTEADYFGKRERDKETDIPSESRVAGSYDGEFDLLPYDTLCDVIIARATDSNGTTVQTPFDDPTFAGYPGNVLLSFTTPTQFGAPGAPTLADIFTDLDPTTPEYDAYALLTQHAPQDPVSGANQSYRASGTTWVQAILERDYPAGTEQIPYKHLLTDSDLDAVDGAGRGICKIKASPLHPGAGYRHTENTVHTGTGKRTSTASIAFRAAHQDTNLASLTNLAVVAVTAGEYDGAYHVQLNLELTQPSGPTTDVITLKNTTVKMKRSTATPYKVLVDRSNRVQADAYHQLNLAAGTISIGSGSNVITGVGTDFTKFQEGWKIKVGAQTLEIESITNATSMTSVTNSGVAVVAQAFTVVISIPQATPEVNPNKTYNVRIVLRGRGNTSTNVDVTFSTGTSGQVLQDTNVPTGLAAPVIDWTAEGRLQIRNLNFGSNTPDQSQTNTLQKKYILIWDNAGNYLDIVNKVVTTTLVVALYEIGLKSHMTLDSVKKKIYKNVFGSAGTFYVAWLASNSLVGSLGFSAQSANSNAITVASMNEVMADGSDGIGGLDATAVMNTRGQLFPNSDFTFSRAAATSLASVTRRVSPYTADVTITTTTTDDVYWITADDVIVWRSNSSRIWVPIKKNIKGREIITLSFQVRTGGSFGATPVITLSVMDNTPTDLTVTPAPISLTGITSSFQMYGGTVELIPDLSGIGNRFLELKTTASLTGTNTLILDKFSLVRGRQIAAWSPLPQYEVGNGGTPDPDTTPTATPAAMVDLGRSIGSQGGCGWDDPGGGGPILF